MRSYTNKDGEQIKVSEKHLNTAVKIQKELQNASPSRKASLKKLVSMMEKEGFSNAESTENYRCMLKAYRKSIGVLPEVAKHADMIADSKLKSIKELVGDMYYEKTENQHYLRQINKGKKELINFSLITEEISEAFKNYDWSKTKIDVKEKTTITGNQMIVCLSDMHIGALVDTDINVYNFEIAKERLTAYAETIIAEAKSNDIKDIHIINLGDVVEHSNMRYGQAFHSEFAFSEQLTKASDAIIKFILALAGEGFRISYAGFAGNHDRVNDKDKNIDGDHAQKPINHAVQIFIENSKDTRNVRYIQAKDYSHSIYINGRYLKFVHGDLDSFRDENLLNRHSSMDNLNYDAIVMGHFHHFREIEVGIDKRILVFGSLKGADEYSDKIRKLSRASQGIIIVGGDSEINVKRVSLN